MRRGRTVREFRERMRKEKQSVNPARQKRINRIKEGREEQRKRRFKELLAAGMIKETEDNTNNSIISSRINIQTNYHILNSKPLKMNWKLFDSYDEYKYKSKHINICHIIESLGLGGGQTMMFELFHGLQNYYGEYANNYIVSLTDKKNFIAAKELVKSYSIDPIPVHRSNLRNFCEEKSIDIVVHHRISISSCLKKLLPHKVKYVLVNHTWHRINRLSQFGACDCYISVCKFLHKRTRWPRHIHSTRKGVVLNGVENNYLSDLKPFELDGDFITGRCHRMVGGKFHGDSINWIDKTFKEDSGHRHYILGTSKSAKTHCSKSKICKYMGTVNNRHKKMSIIKSFHLYFYETFQHEGASIAVMEALAAGVPVLCKDFGGNKEIIAHGVNGYILNNREGFAQIIKKMIKHPKDLELLKESTIIDFNKRLNIRHVACKYMQIFENLIADKGER